MNKKKNPGAPKKVTDEKLKEMALAIKHKHHGKKITFQFLQDETGIGRQTWKRRIEDFIIELNKPLIFPTTLDSENVYFPNIEEIFEKHKNNNLKIIQELSYFERMFRQLYSELSSFKQIQANEEKISNIIEKQKEELILVQQKASHYENLYKNLVIVSGFSHLREQKGIQENLVQFSGNTNVLHTTLVENDFNTMVSNEGDMKKSLSVMFPHLFEEE
ncbi:hypothetical protein [Psychrobacillus sp. FSL H8-0510]|uniref:hypothetical protein n=1 Tax=Psychrobacillus sp. FSL H8-0510 TaxID=2921394 RepID=UPI0030F8518A